MVTNWLFCQYVLCNVLCFDSRHWWNVFSAHLYMWSLKCSLLVVLSVYTYVLSVSPEGANRFQFVKRSVILIAYDGDMELLYFCFWKICLFERKSKIRSVLNLELWKKLLINEKVIFVKSLNLELWKKLLINERVRFVECLNLELSKKLLINYENVRFVESLQFGTFKEASNIF